MLANVLSSIIGGIGSLLNSGVGTGIISAIGTKRSQQRQYEYQSLLNSEQNAFTEKMYNQANEYNNPTNTLQRYIDSGINPGTAVQATTGVNGQANQVGASSSPGVSLADTGQSFAQGSALGADTMLKFAQIQGINANTENTNIRNAFLPQQISYQLEQIQQETSKIKADILAIKADTEYTKSKTSGQDIENFYAPSRITQNLNLWSQQVKESIARIKQGYINICISGYNAMTERQKNELSKYSNDTARMLATSSIELMKHQGIELDSRSENNICQSYLHYTQGKVNEAEKEWKDFTNNVRKNVGSKWYEWNDRLNTIHTGAKILESGTKSADNIARIFKPF